MGYRERETQGVPIARRLRRTSTEEERIVWHRIGRRQIEGAKFRRQHPVGPYIVDFYCDAARLVIEIDGGQHGPDVDRERTAYLEGRGLTVLRFWNNDVRESPDGCVEIVARTLRALAEDIPPWRR